MTASKERDSLVAREQSAAEETRMVADRVRVLQRQIDEQKIAQQRTMQAASAAVDQERNVCREAENNGARRLTALARELEASNQEAEVAARRLTAIHEERISEEHRVLHANEQRSAVVLASVEAQATRAVNIMQAELRTEREACASTERNLSVLAQTMHNSREMTAHEHRAVAAELTARAR